ncbi:hypothetical protein CCAX7_15240 [Capsulimonas corticalis]|uniref:Uncharacterized protein n=1 Tax=Capsulimonas corticalis TaxID=2219043 RepID=A0A402CZD5_9BACT|nr:hypothetical protein [Capsulimonas corticalis]BDI29473.1 hypothetical protein CCAX7_15240 [Capsulimonas corticalis]
MNRADGRRAFADQGVRRGFAAATVAVLVLAPCVHSALAASVDHGRHRGRILREAILGGYALRPPRGFSLRQSPGATANYQWTGPQYNPGAAPSLNARVSSLSSSPGGADAVRQLIASLHQRRAWRNWRQSNGENVVLGGVRCARMTWSGTDRGYDFVGEVVAPLDGRGGLVLNIEDLAGHPTTWSLLQRSLRTLRRNDLT